MLIGEDCFFCAFEVIDDLKLQTIKTAEATDPASWGKDGIVKGRAYGVASHKVLAFNVQGDCGFYIADEAFRRVKTPSYSQHSSVS